MNNNNLKCPFCGNDSYPEIEGEYNYYKASCEYCGASAESGKTESEAIDNWNTREDIKGCDIYLRGFIHAKDKIIRMISTVNPELSEELKVIE